MNKKIVLVSILFLWLCCCLGSCSKKTDFLQRAKEYDTLGEKKEAVELYCKYILLQGKIFPLPNKEASIIIQDSLWRFQLAQYIDWCNKTSIDTFKGYSAVLEGINRCVDTTTQSTSLGVKKSSQLSKAGISEIWKSTFFRFSGTERIDFDSLIAASYECSLSVIKFKTGQSFIYRLWIINQTSGRTIHCVITPSTNQSIFLNKGRYILMCETKVELVDGLKTQSWSSGYEIMFLTIDKNHCVYPLTLSTHIAKPPSMK